MKMHKIVLLILASLSAQFIVADEMLAVSRNALSYSQLLDANPKQDLIESGVHAESRAYYKEISGSELNKGLSISTDAAEAIVQITALESDSSKAVNSAIHLPTKMSLSNGKLSRSVDHPSIASTESSKSLREDFPELYSRSRIMKLPADMGSGRFVLKADTPSKKNSRYMLYVLDKNSDLNLALSTQKNSLSKGNVLEVKAELLSDRKAALVSVRSTLIAPDGRKFSLTGKMKNKHYQASRALDFKLERSPGELWQVETRSFIRTRSRELIERVAVIALDIHPQTAGLVSIDSSDKKLSLGLNVSRAGRYEARALIFAQDKEGKSIPGMLSFHAEWLEAGRQALVVFIDTDKLRKAGLQAPYEVRRVQLLDQGRLANLELKRGIWSVN